MTRSLKAGVAILSTMLLVRGVDYVTGNSYDTDGRVIEDNLTLPGWWGATCLLVAFLVFAALLVGRAPLVKNLCLVAFSVNVMFAVQIYESRMLPFPWPPEDIRLVADHIGHASLWLLFAATVWWREGVRRRRSELLEEAGV